MSGTTNGHGPAVEGVPRAQQQAVAQRLAPGAEQLNDFSSYGLQVRARVVLLRSDTRHSVAPCGGRRGGLRAERCTLGGRSELMQENDRVASLHSLEHGSRAARRFADESLVPA